MLTLLIACLLGATFREAAQRDRNYHLINAINRNDHKDVIKYLTLGADPNTRDTGIRKPFTFPDLLQVFKRTKPREGCTALLLAVGCPDDAPDAEEPFAYPASPTIVKILIESGANVNVRDKIGRTPLIWAVVKSENESAHLLMSHGAALDVVDMQGLSPLSAALMSGSHPLVKELVVHGNLDHEYRSKYGVSPLMWATIHGDKDLMQLFMSRGADPNAKDRQGNTALHLAIYEHDGRAVKLLLHSGANPRLDGQNGMTFLMAAGHEKDKAILKVIRCWLKDHPKH